MRGTFTDHRSRAPAKSAGPPDSTACPICLARARSTPPRRAVTWDERRFCPPEVGKSAVHRQPEPEPGTLGLLSLDIGHIPRARHVDEGALHPREASVRECAPHEPDLAPGHRTRTGIAGE